MPDGTEEKQGVKTSETPKGTSTYTEEQVQERERKVRSDALAEAGRYKADAERASKSAQAALDRLNKMEQERLDADIEAHKDDPAEIKRIRAEQRARQVETDLANERQSKTELENRLKAFESESLERTKQSVAQNVATKFNVDSTKLAALAKLTDGSEQAIEALADAMPKINQKPGFRPDNNKGVGGLLTWEQVTADYIKDPSNPTFRQRYIEAKAQR